jgi:hypothetical protein
LLRGALLRGRTRLLRQRDTSRHGCSQRQGKGDQTCKRPDVATEAMAFGSLVSGNAAFRRRWGMLLGHENSSLRIVDFK